MGDIVPFARPLRVGKSKSIEAPYKEMIVIRMGDDGDVTVGVSTANKEHLEAIMIIAAEIIADA